MDIGTQRRLIIEIAAQNLGATAEYLWPRTPEAFVLRHPANGKWFAVVMRVSGPTLGLPTPGEVDVLNVKCSPLLTGSLLAEPGFLPAYHMNKLHWVSALLDGPLTETALSQLLEMSCQNVAPTPKKARKTGDF